MNKGATILLMAAVGAVFAYLASRPPPSATAAPIAGSANTTDDGRAGLNFGIQDAGAAW